MNKRKKSNPQFPGEQELREMIAQRAYELFQSRGSSDGDAISDWIRAEQEVTRRVLKKPCPLEFTEKPSPKLRLVRKKHFIPKEIPARAEKQPRRKKSIPSGVAKILPPKG